MDPERVARFDGAPWSPDNVGGDGAGAMAIGGEEG